MVSPSALWACVGRRDVFAVQQQNGAYFPVRRPVEMEDLAEHLAGMTSIGSYSLDPNDNVGFVVFDLDTGETNLKELIDCVERTVYPVGPPADGGYPLMLERSGGKGYHIWLFLDKPLPAYRVRCWLEDAFWPEWEAAVGKEVARTLEVFPKQDRVRDLGNLVKLPLGVHAKTGKKSEIVGCENWIVELDSVRRMNTGVIPPYSSRQPKVGPVVTKDTPTGILLKDGPVASLIKGEVAKGERNRAFHAFFTWCAWNIHLPSGLALEWASELNDALPDPETDWPSVEATRDSAYGRAPEDAAVPPARTPRTGPPSGDGYRKVPMSERLAAMRAEREAK